MQTPNNKILRLSIIIPAYNIEKYIIECMSSILKQIDDSVEIIIVDDGSTDKTPAICDELSKKYSNIKVLHKTNGGLSSARNAGMKLAVGEYVWFIDGDDAIAESSISKIFSKIETFNPDIVNLDYTRVYKDNTAEVYHQPFPSSNAVKGIAALHELVAIPAWASVFKRSFLEKFSIQFVEGLIHEDFEYSIKAYSLAESVVHIYDPIYLYNCQNVGSIMNTVTPRSPIGYAESARLIRSFIDENSFTDSEIKIIMRVVAIGITFSLERYLMLSREQKKEVLKYYNKNKKYISNALKYHTLIYRILAVIFCISPKFACFVFSILRKMK